MADKIKVQVMLEARMHCEFECEMTRKQYDEYCERIDNARGFEEESVADDVLDLAGIDIYRNGEIERLRVEDFVEVKPAALKE